MIVDRLRKIGGAYIVDPIAAMDKAAAVFVVDRKPSSTGRTQRGIANSEAAS